MKEVKITKEDFKAITGYIIDTNKVFGLMKTLKLLGKLGISFTDITRGKDIWDKLHIRGQK